MTYRHLLTELEENLMVKVTGGKSNGYIYSNMYN